MGERAVMATKTLTNVTQVITEPQCGKLAPEANGDHPKPHSRPSQLGVSSATLPGRLSRLRTAIGEYLSW